MVDVEVDVDVEVEVEVDVDVEVDDGSVDAVPDSIRPTGAAAVIGSVPPLTIDPNPEPAASDGDPAAPPAKLEGATAAAVTNRDIERMDLITIRLQRLE